MVDCFRIATRACAFLLLVASLSACGSGGGQSAPQNNATVAPLASPMTEAQKEIAALPLSHAAPIPKGLHCKRADVVWVNTNKKTYHLSDDPYFGRTKHGEYMCKEDADAAGDHLAGTRHSKAGHGSMQSEGGSSSP